MYHTCSTYNASLAVCGVRPGLILRRFILCGVVMCTSALPGFALPGSVMDDHSHHNMRITPQGAVMNENRDKLPAGCPAVSRDHSFAVNAGSKYAQQPGLMFGMDLNQLEVDGCSRVTINFTNTDEVRHQWMVHGLPKYLYPAGMFHIEVNGGESLAGTFIVPPEAKNYLIHCDIAQHMEMGMRGQLVVNGGNGNLWGISNVSANLHQASYWPPLAWIWLLLAAATGLILTLAISKRLFRS